MPGSDFLDLPARVGKPRGTGITHVLDRGFPLAQSADLLATGGPYVDVWKFGWGISCLDPNLAAKLELLAAHRVLRGQRRERGDQPRLAVPPAAQALAARRGCLHPGRPPPRPSPPPRPRPWRAPRLRSPPAPR